MDDPIKSTSVMRPREPAAGPLETLSWSGIWFASHQAKMLLPVLLPVITAEFVVGVDRAAIALTGFLLCALAAKLVAGWLADHLPCKPLVAAATLGSAATLLVGSQVTSFTGLTVAWCLLGVCDGVQFSAGLALLGRGARRGTHGKVHGLRLAVNALGTASAPLMVLVWSGDFRVLFLVAAGIAALATFGFLLGVRSQPVPPKVEAWKGSGTRAMTLARGGLGLLVGIIALQSLIAIAGQSVTSFTQQFFVTERQFDLRQSSLIMTVFMAVGVLGPPLWGHLSDRFGRGSALAVALLIHAASILAVSFLPRGPLLIASFAVFGLVRAAVYPVTYAVISERFPAHQGRVFGVSAAAGHLAGALGLMTVGSLAEGHGFARVYPLLAAVPLAGVLLVLALTRWTDAFTNPHKRYRFSSF